MSNVETCLARLFASREYDVVRELMARNSWIWFVLTSVCEVLVSHVIATWTWKKMTRMKVVVNQKMYI
jgi:hypothetical protein